MKYTIAEFIILRLKQLGCHHVFGIPGTSCSDFFNALDRDTDIDYVLTVNELEAGYMADGYGRQGTIGAVCVSYGVGTLSLANAVASALTERVPLIVLNGGPTSEDWCIESEYGVLFSHSTGFGKTDFNVFKNLTISSNILSDLTKAGNEIDDLLKTALTNSGPVYLEIPQDYWTQHIDVPDTHLAPIVPKSSTQLDKIIEEIQQRLSASKHPVVMLGSELVRFNLAKDALRFIEKQQLPFFTTLLSKSIIPEQHPLFGGVYDSDLAPKVVRNQVENADLLVSFGCVFGIDHRFMVKKQYENMISIEFGAGRVGSDKYLDIHLPEVLDKLNQLNRITQDRNIEIRSIPLGYADRRINLSGQPEISEDIHSFGHEAIFHCLDAYLSEDDRLFFVGLDTCLASYPGADLPLKHPQTYLANPVWLAIGQGTPATVGAYFATKKRPLIVTGDGGFQMVSQTFSTMVRYKVPAIIIVIDNGSYAIEQFLIDGDYFLNSEKTPLAYTKLNAWKYENLPSVYNGGFGIRVNSAETFNAAIRLAETFNNQPVIIAATVSDRDLPPENWIYLKGK